MISLSQNREVFGGSTGIVPGACLTRAIYVRNLPAEPYARGEPPLTVCQGKSPPP